MDETREDMGPRLEQWESILAAGDGPAAQAGLAACQALRTALEEHAALRKALCFYADCTSWHRDFIGGAHVDSRAMDDMGQRAREALGQPK